MRNVPSSTTRQCKEGPLKADGVAPGWLPVVMFVNEALVKGIDVNNQFAEFHGAQRS